MTLDLYELLDRIKKLEKLVRDLESCQCAGFKSRLYELKKREEAFDLEAER